MYLELELDLEDLLNKRRIESILINGKGARRLAALTLTGNRYTWQDLRSMYEAIGSPYRPGPVYSNIPLF